MLQNIKHQYSHMKEINYKPINTLTVLYMILRTFHSLGSTYEGLVVRAGRYAGSK
ncbi:hypothetical protein VCHA40P238_50046 [Vibrio chagasii]|nr:hypothetical protein VCHA34P120_240048 [Vibrio chagasii]CAH7336436.1 hypothetical protein VCHA40P238_50046 [Vibrio chagasii]